MEQREGQGVCGEGEDDLCAPAGHKARARATGAPSLTMRPEDRYVIVLQRTGELRLSASSFIFASLL